ncbi:MAG: FMN-binding negative transcriptional regulator [Mucilaginibacter sp.]|nr:FMN-binding negative transcriptional regulator [Mucilaginibacter sp.]
MYIPSFNLLTNKQEAISFLQKYSFATIITAVNGVPEATHLPFLVKQENDKIYLLSHFAKANPQSAHIIDNTSLVIFTEPHAYISPRNYEKEENVPTWNYIAIHTYGNAVLIEDEAKKAELLKHTIEYYDAGYLQQWDKLSDHYKSKMMKGIVAFEIEVTDLQGKQKLSQNRTEQERENIINSLSKSDDANEKEIAAYMSKLSDGQKP